MAVCLDRLRRKPEAMIAYETFLGRHPDFEPWVKQARERLERYRLTSAD